MKNLICAVIALMGAIFCAGIAAPAHAANCSNYTYTLTNGQTADATQVMSNFNTILTCANSNLAKNGINADITSLTGLTTPLSAAQGGTGVLYGLGVDFNVFIGGQTGNAWTLATYQPSTDIVFTAAKARCAVGVAATASTTFTLKDNGSAIGTAIITAGTTTCVATITSTPYTVSAGHTLTVIGPATADTTAADIGITFGGVRQ